MVKSSVKQQNPGICELDLKIAVFKRYYSIIFEKEEMDRIIRSLINYMN